jgi:hypothetical protein
MILRKVSIVTAALVLSAAWTGAEAYEAGFPGWEQKPGITLGGGTAAAPPPGVYMFNQFLTYQAQLVGPTAPNIGGAATQIHVASATTGIIIVPGWEFLGASYNAVIVQPFITSGVGPPVNVQPAGMHNTYIVPVELSWKLGQSGFFVKTGLGIYVPDGSISGINGLGNIGNPWWTFQPEFVISYLKDGWNFTAFIFEEINTANTITNYRSGNVLHAEFTAAKTINKWTFGPVAYYAGQVTSDKSSAFYGNVINTKSYDIWAVGGRVGYDFGPVAMNVWALNEVSSQVVGANPNVGSVPKGYSVYASFSYRLWAPDAPATPKIPLIHK